MRWSRSSVRLRPDLLALGLLAAGPLAAGPTAYVTCQNGDALSVLDLDTGIETNRWSLPGQPAGVAVADGIVVTVSAGSKTVRRLDHVSGALLAEMELDGGPIGVALDSDRNRLFVSDWYNARIWVLGVETLDILSNLRVGAAPAGLALSDDGRFLASADRDANQVTIFDADTLATLRHVPVGARPFGLRFDPDGRLFVGNVGSNDVTVLDPETGRMLATVPVGERPYGVAFAQGRAFVTNQYENTVSVIDLADFSHEAKISAGDYPEGIDATPSSSAIVVANWFDNTVTVIDANTLDVLHDIETCDGPRAFGLFVLGDAR